MKIPLRIIEAAIKRLTEPDEVQQQETYDSLTAALDSAPDGDIWPQTDESFGMLPRKFEKRNGQWFVKTLLSNAELSALLNQQGKQKLDAAIKSKLDDLPLDADDFIESTGKGVNFVRQGDNPNAAGIWRDNTPLPSKMIAAYKYNDQVQNVMPVEREGDLRVVRDEELMFVLDKNSSNFYIMSSKNNHEDPLLSMKQLFNALQIHANFGVTDNSIAGKTVTNEQLVKLQNFIDKHPPYDISMSLFKGGKIEDAMKKARTTFGKIFDIFSGPNLQMQFELTQWGPAFKRTQQLLAQKPLDAQSFEKFEGTDYFEPVKLEKVDFSKYKLKMGDKLVDLPFNGLVPNIPQELTQAPPLLKIQKTLGCVYDLYLLGFVYEENTASSTSTNAKAELPPPQDPLAALWGKPIDPANDAAFFVFNKTSYDVQNGRTDLGKLYAEGVAKTIVDFCRKYQGQYGTGMKPITMTIIGTADQVGEEVVNSELSKKRCDKLGKDIMESVSSQGFASGFDSMPLGEKPWVGSSDAEKESSRLYKRFAKAYWGQGITQANAIELAQHFTSDVAAASEAEVIKSKQRIASATK